MKGTCKHGEFELEKGCPECIEERRATMGISMADVTPETETSIALRPGEDLEAHNYYEESMNLLNYAESRVIANLDDNKMANNDLSLISKLKKAMEAKKREYLDPLKVEMDAIRATYDYLMTPVLMADKITRAKMLAFDAEQRRIRAEQEEINRLREEAAQKQKELTGEITEVEIVEVMPGVSKNVTTDMGTSGRRDNWKYEVINVDLIPREYMMPDTAMLNAIAKKTPRLEESGWRQILQRANNS